jgi:DNA-binding transcriptional LysR family regulator
MMNLRNIDLNLLTVFEVIMRERNTTHAATQLSMSQSSVSKALSRLRVILDDPLFIREAGEMTPTKRAVDIFESVNSGLDHIRSGLSRHDNFNYEKSDITYNIAAVDYFSEIVFHRVADLLSNTAHNVKVKIHPVPVNLNSGIYSKIIQNILDSLKEGSLDIFIHFDTSLTPMLKCQKLLEDEWVGVAGEDFAVEPTDENFKPFFDASAGHISSGHTHWEEQVKSHLYQKPSVVEIQNLNQVLKMVNHSNYTGVVPRKALSGYAYPLKVQRLNGGLPPFNLYQFWHQNVQNHSSHQWLRRLLLAQSKRL